MPQPRLDPLARAERRRLGRPGAGHQEGFGAALAQPEAQPLHVADERQVALLLRADQQVGERRAGELLLLPALERPEARHEPRLGGKGGEQALGEGVDGLDAKPAAGRLEHGREPGPRARSIISGTGSSSSALKLACQLLVLEPHPVRQAGVDALGHLGGARLGEGQAEDRGGVDAGEQQPQHPRGQDMGLAGARRGRKRGVDARRRGAQLVALELGKWTETAGHRRGGAKAIGPGTRKPGRVRRPRGPLRRPGGRPPGRPPAPEWRRLGRWTLPPRGPPRPRGREPAQKMNAPATNAMAAIIQSRACMSLMKSISTSSILQHCIIYIIHVEPRFQGDGRPRRIPAADGAAPLFRLPGAERLSKGARV